MVKPGMFINERYEIIALIGSGGTADVYKAKDHRLNRFVAIKILKASFTGDSKIVAKFRQEAQACAGLTHPNIVSIYDVGNDGNLYYIVMELIEGITLKKFIEKKGKLEMKEAIGIAIQISQGLDAAHANHIVHRDIKPQNIIISREGKVKVTDFGIARATLGTSTNTINQAPVGSVHYLSPEQARGGFSDEKSDIYSLGVTIYEMLAGKVPFSGDNNVSVALLHIQGEATPLHEINPEVTPSIEKIVVKCMQKKPDRRYFSASELIADLKAAVTNPSGDFVKLGGRRLVNDSPTINMTEAEANAIRKQALYEKSYNNIPDEDDYDEEEPYDDGYDNYYDDDDDELDKVNNKTETFIIIGSIVLVLSLIALIIFVLVPALTSNNKKEETKQEKTFKLSDDERKKLLNSDYDIDQMTAALHDKGIYDFIKKDKFNDDYDENMVTALYYDGDTLVVEVSLGAKPANTVKMPDIVSKKLTFAQAREELLKLSPDFHVIGVESDEHSDIEANIVIAQDVDAGDDIELTKEIKLTYSIGPEALSVPDLLSNAYDKEMVKNQYGDLFEFRFEYDNENSYSTTKANIVVKTSPEAGSSAKKGDEIVVYLSSTVVKMPDVKNKAKADAEKALTSVGLKVEYGEEEFSDTVTAGCVVSASETTGDSIDRGKTVKLVLSKGPKPADPTPTPTNVPLPSDTPEPEQPTPEPEEPGEA